MMAEPYAAILASDLVPEDTPTETLGWTRGLLQSPKDPFLKKDVKKLANYKERSA